MDRINQFSFYDLGRNLKQLVTFEGDQRPGDIFFHLMNAERTLKDLINGEPIELGVSRGTADILHDYVQKIISDHYWIEDPEGNRTFNFPGPNDPLILSYKFDWYRQLLTNFETVFSEEMRLATTYYAPRRGIFFTPSLVDSADETFPNELFSFIPPKARAEWRAAGRCLAFNLLSASGFHVARAVEAVIEVYFQKFCIATKKAQMTWGDYVADLDKVLQTASSPGPDKKTISEIKQMKDDYRNPLMHPRVVLSEADARMLFANGESLIIAMAQELQSAQSGMQPMPESIHGGTTP